MALFVIDLNYTVELQGVDALTNAHRGFLKEQYENGLFLASGPKRPRTGGVILAQAEQRSDIERVIELDPFKSEGIADYTITEFTAVMHAPGFPI